MSFVMILTRAKIHAVRTIQYAWLYHKWRRKTYFVHEYRDEYPYEEFESLAEAKAYLLDNRENCAYVSSMRNVAHKGERYAYGIYCKLFGYNLSLFHFNRLYLTPDYLVVLPLSPPQFGFDSGISSDTSESNEEFIDHEFIDHNDDHKWYDCKCWTDKMTDLSPSRQKEVAMLIYTHHFIFATYVEHFKDKFNTTFENGGNENEILQMSYEVKKYNDLLSMIEHNVVKPLKELVSVSEEQLLELREIEMDESEDNNLMPFFEVFDTITF